MESQAFHTRNVGADPSPWSLGRALALVGVGLDLGLLAYATRGNRTTKERLVTALIGAASTAALGLAANAAANAHKPPLIASVTINRSPRDVEAFFQRHVPELDHVTFSRAPARSATEVRVEIARGFGKVVLREKVQNDLRKIKQVLETGEVLINHGEEMP